MTERPLQDLLELASERQRLIDDAQRREEELAEQTGRALRQARVAADMSQSELAVAAGVSQAYLSQVENGRIATPERIESLTGVIVSRSKGGTDARTNQKSRKARK